MNILSNQHHQEHDCVRVLLFITTRRRDSVPMKRLAKALTDRGGYCVLLSGMSDFHFAIQDFSPHIIIIGKPDNAQGDWLRCLSGCTVISLNTEQGGLDERTVLRNYLEGQGPNTEQSREIGPALQMVDHHLIIDRFTKSILSPYIDPEKMHVVGYPRLIQSEFALTARPVSDNFTIGFACGVNIFDRDFIFETFECWWNRPYPPWPNVEAALADNVLEHLWTNHLVDMLKTQHQVLVRYRPGDGSYLRDESGVELDYSDSVEFLLSTVDLLIVGYSTVGVEALMVGVPAVSLAGLVSPTEDYVGASDYWVPQLVWSPPTLNDLLELVTSRSRDRLPLCPNVDHYATEVANTYFCGGTSDRSIERMVSVVDECERGTGAQLDVATLLHLCSLGRLQRLLLRFPKSVSTRIPYRLAVWYSKLRHRFSSDSYLQHHVFLPD